LRGGRRKALDVGRGGGKKKRTGKGLSSSGEIQQQKGRRSYSLLWTGERERKKKYEGKKGVPPPIFYPRKKKKRSHKFNFVCHRGKVKKKRKRQSGL